MLLTCTGLIAKVMAFYSLLHHCEKDKIYKKIKLLVVLQLIQTFFEFFGYIASVDYWLSLPGLKLYYFTTFATLSLIPIIVAEISGFKVHRTITRPLLIAFVVISSLLCNW